MTSEALRLAQEFVADPDKRAQVKVQLAANGLPKLADMIDEAVIVSRAYLAALERERTARNDALEEAASFAWENTGHCCEDVAGKIRALKTAALDKKEKS